MQVADFAEAGVAAAGVEPALKPGIIEKIGEIGGTEGEQFILIGHAVSCWQLGRSSAATPTGFESVSGAGF